MMKQFRLPVCAMLALIVLCCQADVPVVAQEAVPSRTASVEGASGTAWVSKETQMREVIVSCAQENSKLQLYRVYEDGSSRRRITDGKHDCMMPAWSPDGEQVVYVRQSKEGLNLWLCDPDGRQHKQLTQSGSNRVPSWLPDSKHVVWMVSTLGDGLKDPASSSQLRIMNTETMESRRLFSDAEQIKFSNAMPVVSPQGTKIAFVSNRGGNFRVWLSNLDGSDAKPISPVATERDKTLDLPIEQKVPSWSPDGKWIAHWEGVEMIHMSRFTGKRVPKRDQLIAATFHVWVVGSDGKNKRKAGRGDDPNWSPDGFVTRSFPDPKRGGANVMIEESNNWEELPILPMGTTRYGRFTWKPY
jgi:dipeptidyl aminopeptidase/acylaminoacyl peptidase